MTYSDGISTECSDAREPLSVRDARLQRVLDIIRTQPSQSVRALALEVRLSPAHLQRLFRQQTGVHIRDLLVEGRLQKAAALLSASKMQIKEIAYTVGYQHFQHGLEVRAIPLLLFASHQIFEPFQKAHQLNWFALIVFHKTKQLVVTLRCEFTSLSLDIY